MQEEPRFGPSVAAHYDEWRSVPAGVTAALHDRVVAATGMQRGDRLLEVGAGTGALSAAFINGGYRYVALDSSAAMLARFATRSHAARAALVQGDLRALPFPYGSVDVLIALRVFGALPGWRRALQECVRFLRPGGSLIIGRVRRGSAGSGGLHVFLREERNRMLSAMGIDTRRRGGDEGAVMAELASVTATQERLPELSWRTLRTARRALRGNLTGWRLQALPQPALEELGSRLLERLRDRYADLDAPIEEEAAFVLHHARKRVSEGV